MPLIGGFLIGALRAESPCVPIGALISIRKRGRRIIMSNVIHVNFGQKSQIKSFYNSIAEKSADSEYLKGCQLDESSQTWDQAAKHYRLAIRLNPQHVDSMVNLANIWKKKQGSKKATALYKKVLRIDPEHTEANYNYAYVCYEQHKFDLAVTHFERALALQPDFADAHFNLAMVYSELGEKHKAWPHWQRYLLIDPNSRWANVARDHLRRSV